METGSQDTKGRKFDKLKPDWSLLPTSVMTGVVWVLTLGKIKYDRENWKLVDNPIESYYAALMRHITAWWNDGDYKNGEQYDGEYSTHHLLHALCCLVFITWFELKRLGDSAWSFKSRIGEIAAKMEEVKREKLAKGETR